MVQKDEAGGEEHGACKADNRAEQNEITGLIEEHCDRGDYGQKSGEKVVPAPYADLTGTGKERTDEIGMHPADAIKGGQPSIGQEGCSDNSKEDLPCPAPALLEKS